MPIAGTPPSSPKADAVQRYLIAREDALLPRAVSRRAITFLWLLLAAQLGGAGVASLVRVPVFATGPAVVLPGHTHAFSESGAPVVAVFLPKAAAGQLRVGQKIVLDLGDGPDPRIVRVEAVEPEVRGPAQLSKRFLLSGAAAAAVTRPSVVALTRWAADEPRTVPAAHAGSVYRADVEIGARRAVSFLPVVGTLFGGQG